MDEQFRTLEDYLAILRRRKWQLIVPAVFLAAAAIATALLIPATYRSSATILIEQQEIPPDLVRSTVTSYADQRVQVISQRVLTTRNLSEVIEKYNLYPEIRRKFSLNMAVEEMRKDVNLKMISADVVDPQSGRAQKATIAFSLSFDSPSPVLAQKVTNDVVSLFLNENLRQRQAVVKEASDFLQEEGKKLGEHIGALETQLAKFKEEHADNLPEFIALTREFIARTEDRLRDNAQATRTREEQKIYLESELTQLSPRLGTLSAAGTPISSPEARLRELEARYPGIASGYSPKHPDRIQMERELAALRKEVARSDTSEIKRQLGEQKRELAALKERYSENHPDVKRVKGAIAAMEARLVDTKGSGQAQEGVPDKPDNPPYVQLQTQLAATDAELGALRQARSELETTLAAYEKRLTEGPKIEQEYRALTRDYDNAVASYREVKEKTMAAELAQTLESERKGERFSLIEPPLVPEKPEKPNRPAILMLGLVLSFAGGFGNLAIREALDKSVRGAHAVLAITQAPPLAVIPYIETMADRRRRARRVWIFVVAAVVVLLTGVAAVHFFVMPLDILWYTLLRRIDTLMPMSAHTAYLRVFAWSA